MVSWAFCGGPSISEPPAFAPFARIEDHLKAKGAGFVKNAAKSGGCKQPRLSGLGPRRSPQAFDPTSPVTFPNISSNLCRKCLVEALGRCYYSRALNCSGTLTVIKREGDMVMTEERTRAIDLAIGQIEKQFGRGAIMRLGERKNLEIESIPTGSLALDL